MAFFMFPTGGVVVLLWLALFLIAFGVFSLVGGIPKTRSFLLSGVATGLVVGAWLLLCACFVAFSGYQSCVLGYVVGATLMLATGSMMQYVMRKCCVDKNG